MAAYKHCAKCPVTKAVQKLLGEYEYFLQVSCNPTFVYMTDHARGNHHGKIASIEEIISDLQEIIPFIETESGIAGGR